MSPDQLEARQRPQSLGDLFLSFTWMALQGFGGVMAVVQRELVEKKRWLTREEFLEEWAVAQIMPGPNVINLAMMIGARHFGPAGALAALAGMVTVPIVIVLSLTVSYSQYGDSPQVIGALRGIGAVAAGLVAATGLRLLGALKTHPLGLVISASLSVLCFVAIAILRLPLGWVLPVLGGAACLLTYRQLK